MKYLFSTKIRIVLVATVLIAAALAVVSNLTGYTAGDMVVKGILSPLRAGASSLTDQVFSEILRAILERKAEK